MHKTEYLVANNTDYQVPFITTSRRQAERIWRKIRPNASAGNLYSARFEYRCGRCGEWQDMLVDYATCECK